MCEISCSQPFRTTIGIQSGPGTFDISRLVITFSTNLEITEILCSFRLRENKQISESSRLEFLENILAKTFALSDAESNTYGSLNTGGITDLFLLRTLIGIRQKSWELSFLEVIDSFVLVE